MIPRFFRRLAEGVFDIEDLKLRTNELADFVEKASAAYGFDARNVMAVGYSNGANITASILLLRPKTLSGVILFRAMVPLVPDRLLNLSGKRVFMSSGLQDPIATKNEAETLSDLLRQAGADVTLRWQDSGHELTKQDVTSARQWLAQRPNKDLVVSVLLLVCNAHRIMYAYTILTQHNLFSLAFFQTKALLFPQGLPSCYSVVNKICPYLPLSPRMSRPLLL
jgi:predicted esterase